MKYAATDARFAPNRYALPATRTLGVTGRRCARAMLERGKKLQDQGKNCLAAMDLGRPGITHSLHWAVCRGAASRPRIQRVCDGAQGSPHTLQNPSAA